MAYSCWAALSATYRTLSRSLPRGRCGPCFSMMPNGSRQVPWARAIPSLKSAAVSSSQCTESLFCEALTTWMASSNEVYTCPPRGPSKGVSNGIRRKKGVNDERRTSRPGAAERGVRPCGEIGFARTASADHPEGAKSELPRHGRLCSAGGSTHPAGDGPGAILPGLHDSRRHRQKLAATPLRADRKSVV